MTTSPSTANITKIAVISDTHAYLDPRIEKIIADCDYALHAGDICGVNVIEVMRPKRGQVVAVAGNNDPYCHFSDAPLPESIRVEIAGATLAVEHGHKHGARLPSHESLRKAHPNAKIVVYGHTHQQVIDQTSSPWVINPGAAGKTRTNGGPSCLVIECHTDKEWQINAFRFVEELA